MPRVQLIKGLLMNLNGDRVGGQREFLTPEQARNKLMEMTGQDFGIKAEEWKRWLLKAKKNGDPRFQEPF